MSLAGDMLHYSKKYEKLMARVTEPLKQLGIEDFIYEKLSIDGQMAFVCNMLPKACHYVQSESYKIDTRYRHLDGMPEGHFLSNHLYNEAEHNAVLNFF